MRLFKVIRTVEHGDQITFFISMEVCREGEGLPAQAMFDRMQELIDAG